MTTESKDNRGEKLSVAERLNQILKKVKQVKSGLDPKSLRIKPRSYWQDFTVSLERRNIFQNGFFI